MDCQMPIIDGYEATREIRQRGNTILIIALTANEMSGERKKSIDAGMNDYISKPFKLAELLSLLDKWISQNKKTVRPKAMLRLSTNGWRVNFLIWQE
jgi:CheY-like chemotaxis protein